MLSEPIATLYWVTQSGYLYLLQMRISVHKFVIWTFSFCWIWHEYSSSEWARLLFNIKYEIEAGSPFIYFWTIFFNIKSNNHAQLFTWYFHYSYSKSEMSSESSIMTKSQTMETIQRSTDLWSSLRTTPNMMENGKYRNGNISWNFFLYWFSYRHISVFQSFWSWSNICLFIGTG